MIQTTLGEKEFKSQTDMYLMQASQLTGSMSIGKSLNHSEPLFPEPSNGSSNSIFPVGLL